MAGRVNSKISTTNKQFQSRCFTLAKRDFNSREEDLLMQVVEYAQKQVKGYNLKELSGLQMNLWGDVRVELNISELSENRTERQRYRAAARKLVSKLIEFEKGNGDWLMIPFFQRVEKHGDNITVQVAKEIWDCMLDFSRRCIDMYSLEIALTLKSQYSKRFYMIISQATDTKSYSLESLNKGFGTEYTAKMFENRVLNVAKGELDKIADWSFTYKPYYPTPKQWAEMKATGAKGRMPILGWKITPVRIHNVEVDDKLRRRMQGSYHDTPKQVRDWLVNNMEFDASWLGSQDDEIYQALKFLGSSWEEEFDSIKAEMHHHRAEIKCLPPYFMTCLKNRIETLKNPLNDAKNGLIDKFRFT